MSGRGDGGVGVHVSARASGGERCASDLYGVGWRSASDLYRRGGGGQRRMCSRSQEGVLARGATRGGATARGVAGGFRWSPGKRSLLVRGEGRGVSD